MDQMTLDYVVKTDAESIKEAIVKEINKPEYTVFLSVEEKKDEKISISAKSFLAARVKLTKKTKYVTIREKNREYFNDYINSHGIVPATVKENNDIWIRLPISSVADVLEMVEPISAVYMTILADFGGERFGCCSRYEQCSDTKECIHPDFILSRACAYRRNLEEGRIFYGKHRNRD